MAKDYLHELHELRELLGWLLRKEFLEELVALCELIDRSYAERYVDLCEGSKHGSNCGYAVKAKELFLKLQEKPIREKITHIYKTFIEEKR